MYGARCNHLFSEIGKKFFLKKLLAGELLFFHQRSYQVRREKPHIDS
jgi:hypothetical protein